MRSRSASRTLLGLCSVIAALWAPVSHGEEKPLWEFGMGVGGIAFPDYRGSDETRVIECQPVGDTVNVQVSRRDSQRVVSRDRLNSL